ncbi:MAG: helix-turn-helix domain-containing protein [Nitrospinae bacterium]|nr:helix-turn-helix domain-containing protein [Nitrospinota bacterium]
MNFETVLARIKEVKALRHDNEVATLLGLGKTAFAERKRRNSLPVDKLAVFCEKESINMNWILSGKGRKEKCRQDIIICAIFFPLKTRNGLSPRSSGSSRKATPTRSPPCNISWT